MKILCRILMILALFSGVAGCGKTGPLYLPDTEPAANTSVPAGAGK